MSQLSVTVEQIINAPHSLVRTQFGDVAHHAATTPHRGISFEVESDDGARCRYKQVTRAGPIRLRQTLELERSDVAPLVNHIVEGQLTGGSISFDFQPTGPNSTTVIARLDAPLRGLKALMLPVLRRNVRRALTRALDEDRDDLESGRYELLLRVG